MMYNNEKKINIRKRRLQIYSIIQPERKNYELLYKPKKQNIYIYVKTHLIVRVNAK